MSIQRDQVYRIDTRKPATTQQAEADAEAAKNKSGGTGSSGGGEASKRLAAIAGALVLLLAAVWFFLIRGPSTAFNVDHPTGFHFVCGNGHEFTKSEADLRDYQANHLGEPIKCPTCGDTHVHQTDAAPRAAGRKTK
jgi:hypothetical protein